MLTALGSRFTALFRKYMPDTFVFALVLTLFSMISALVWTPSGPEGVLDAWYKGFWGLLEFGMQMVLLVVTGYSIALSPLLGRLIDRFTSKITRPGQVYVAVTFAGGLLCLVSWGWIVIAAVLARELSRRVPGVHYPYLVACVYASFLTWVCGLSSSIPLLLNTPENFLITNDVLGHTLSTKITLGSDLNLVTLGLLLLGTPALMYLLRPEQAHGSTIHDLSDAGEQESSEVDVKEEADRQRLHEPSLSDRMNHSRWLQWSIVVPGLIWLGRYFWNYGADLNLNLMIFLFIMLGMLLHSSPLRYVVAMKRACGNVSGIVFQFPFYAGIMGIMIHTGLAETFAGWLASMSTVNTYAWYAYLSGALVNFAIPSAGGEFAVIGPGILQAVQSLAEQNPGTDVSVMMGRASMAIAYGESLSNLMQPFFLLLILPVLGKGIKLQARDVMGYLFIPFVFFFALQGWLIWWLSQ